MWKKRQKITDIHRWRVSAVLHITAVAETPLTVLPIRRGVSANPPGNLWIIKQNAQEQLNEFIQNADERTIHSLSAAQINNDVSSMILLHAPRLQSALELNLEADRYSLLQMIPGIYIPQRYSLVPFIRREFLRTLFDDRLSMTWLEYLESNQPGKWVLHTIGREQFQPLSDLVQYVTPEPVSVSHRAFDAEIFRLENFSTRQEQSATKAKKSADNDQDVDITFGPIPRVLDVKPVRIAVKAEVEEELESLNFPQIEQRPALEQLLDMQNRFMEISGEYHIRQRQALWPAIARLSAINQFHDEARLAWVNAFWTKHKVNFSEVNKYYAEGVDLILRGYTDDDCEHAETIAFSLAVSRSVVDAPILSISPSAMAKLIAFLEVHESQIPIRIIWLAWQTISELSGGDVLTLTRARDRILATLLDSGLRRDRDFASFFSRTGGKTDHLQDDTDWIRQLIEKTRQWVKAKSAPHRDLMVRCTFAIALNQGGNNPLANWLMTTGAGLPKTIAQKKAFAPHQLWLFAAFTERLQATRERLTSSSPLSPALWEQINHLDPKINTKIRDPYAAPPKQTVVEKRAAEKYIHMSRILDPTHRIDPYRDFRNESDSLQAKLNELLDTHSRDKKATPKSGKQLEEGFMSLFKEFDNPNQAQRILARAMPGAVRIGDSFAVTMQKKILQLFPKLRKTFDYSDIVQRVEILHWSIVVSVHFDRLEMIPELLKLLKRAILEVKGEIAARLASALPPNIFRFWSRLGLQENAREILDSLVEVICQGKNVQELFKTRGFNRSVYYPALLKLCDGWLYFGETEKARLVLQTVKAELLAGLGVNPRAHNQLVGIFLSSLFQDDPEYAQNEMADFLEQLPLWGLADDCYYMSVVEALALGVSNEQFYLNQHLKRWMDEDEQVIRKRIHDDVMHAISS